MNKTSKKSINLSAKILAILIFSILIIPTAVFAGEGGYNYVYNSYTKPIQVEVDNTAPTIGSISPSYGTIATGAKTVTITGSGFIPGSVARLNGSNRVTTFIDYSHLLVQVTANDMYRTDGFFITVFNGAPGGGYSNGAFFTVKTVATPVVSTNKTVNNTNTNTTTKSTTTTETNNNTNENNTSSTTNTQNTTSENSSATENLASNVIFGSNSFMPSGLIQWILLGIIILIIIILARKLFGPEEEYHSTPLKHA